MDVQKNGCTGKKLYTTESAANKAGLQMPQTQRAYECPHCFCWHLTTQKKLHVVEDFDKRKKEIK